MGPIAKGWLYEVSHVFSGSMALLVPLWLRLSLGPMREEGGFGSAGRHRRRQGLLYQWGEALPSARTFQPKLQLISRPGFQYGPYVKASLFISPRSDLCVPIGKDMC